MNPPPVNPFANNIVSEPRLAEKSVQGLNDDALNRLFQAFSQLSNPGPNNRSPYAHLVTSVEPGFGKSHLIGRLFHTLDRQATLVYLKPFQDPSSCWRSILDKIVVELEYPDRANALACAPGELSQMDVFARHIAANLLARQIEEEHLPHVHKEESIVRLRQVPEEIFQDSAWREWIWTNRELILNQVDQGLKTYGIRLQGGRRAWLKVLLTIACCSDSAELHELCLNWIRLQPLAEEEAQSLQLNPSEIPQVDFPYQQRNEECCQRILDLCQLASFYRPFVFCFDQTELYENSPELAYSFGTAIFRLRDEGCNSLIVITANQQVWSDKVHCHFEAAHRHRIGSHPIPLKGIQSAQAEELVRNRLSEWNIEEKRIVEFLSNTRLGDPFQHKGEVSVREFLMHCRSLWENIKKPQPPKLEELFETYRAELLSSPKKLRYDAGMLQWIFQHLFSGRASYDIQGYRSEKGYFTVRWDAPEEQILFGFEEGSHWRRWQAIHREAARYFESNRQKNRKIRIVFFRVPDQVKIPGERWAIRSEIEASISQFFSVLHLSAEETASLYAAHDLYADVVQGNQAFKKGEALDFLGKKLECWIDKVSKPPGNFC